MLCAPEATQLGLYTAGGGVWACLPLPLPLPCPAPRCYAYLEAAASVAREQWTQFGNGAMAAGLVVFAASLVLQAAAAFGGGGCSAGPAPTQPGPRNEQPAPAGVVPISRLAALGRQLRAWQLADSWQPGQRLPVPTFRAWLASMALLHGVGIFSFFFLLSEGKPVLLHPSDPA